MLVDPFFSVGVITIYAYVYIYLGIFLNVSLVLVFLSLEDFDRIVILLKKAVRIINFQGIFILKFQDKICL